MKGQFLISFLFLSSFLQVNAQWSGNNPIYTNYNVGIGTTAPLGKLDIFSSTANDVLLSFPCSSNSTVKACWFSVDGNDNSVFTTTNGHINFKTNWNGGAPLSTLFLKSDGNVGIGTTSPDAIIHAKGGSTMTGTWQKTVTIEAQAPFLSFNSYNTKWAGIGYDYYSDKLYIFTGANTLDVPTGTCNMSIGGGKVGIGITTPVESLDVYSGGIITSGALTTGRASSATMSYEGGVGAYFISYGPGTTTRGTIIFNQKTSNQGSSNTPIEIKNDGTILLAQSLGYVGIGTTTPQNLLDVYGTVHAKEFKASLDGWSDYVFDKDYRLMSLNEVENYINTNKKLPEIPSAKEVTTDGVKLEEMNALLLKKVEELTLYVIEQNKKIQSLDKKIEKLESEKTNKF